MKKNINFENSIKRLEEIVDKMEREDMELDKSLKLFEEGVGLVRACSSKLEEAKKKIEILVKSGDKVSKQPFKVNCKNNEN
ncbi:exodeoxyribonuclease VII small subunit [Elusimicrobiota bacterium]